MPREKTNAASTSSSRRLQEIAASAPCADLSKVTNDHGRRPGLFAKGSTAREATAIYVEKDATGIQRTSAAMATKAELRVDGAVPTTATSGSTRDPDIRSALRDLLASSVTDTDTLVVEELPIAFGFVKMDVAVLNGRLEGYEIKSDRDRLNRLGRQMELYAPLFDRLTVITTARHVERVRAEVPPWCGISTVDVKDEHMVFTSDRPALSNPDWDVLAVLFLLWQSETVALARAHGLTRIARDVAKGLIHRQLSRRVDHDVLRAAVLDRLRRRRWTPKQLGLL
jgi:hypothetical protein